MAFPRKTKVAKRNIPKTIGHPVMPSELTIPDHFRCPISLDLMRDPVTAPTGITYDRQSIERWLDMGNSTCPVTHIALHGDDFIPNHTIRRLIQDWCVQNGSHGIERIPTPRIPITAYEASEILCSLCLATQCRDGQRCLELARRVRTLGKESERNRRFLVSNGAPLALFYAFRISSTESLELLAEILGALVALFPFDDEIAVLESGSLESLDSLVRIMKHGDVSSQLDAVLLLKKFLSSGEGVAKSVFEKNGIVEALTTFIRDPVSTQVTKASLVATFHLVSSHEEAAIKFVNLGMIPLVVETLVDSDKSMTEKALAVLDGLCNSESGREEACGHALTVPVLAKKMFRVSDMATEFVVSALWKLCKSCKARCLAECLQVGVFQKLLLLLQIGCRQQSKEKATEMLKLMSTSSENLECVDTTDFRGLNRPS